MIYRVQSDSRRRQRVHADMRVHRMHGLSAIAHQLRHDAQPARAAGGRLVSLRGMLHQRGAYAVEQPEPDELLLSVEGFYFPLSNQRFAAAYVDPLLGGNRHEPHRSVQLPHYVAVHKPDCRAVQQPSCTLCPQACAAPVVLSA